MIADLGGGARSSHSLLASWPHGSLRRRPGSERPRSGKMHFGPSWFASSAIRISAARVFGGLTTPQKLS
jgi:hypothetical protein